MKRGFLRSTGLLLLPVIPLATLWTIWEVSCAQGWLRASVFPPPSRFIPYIVGEDFSIGVGRQRATVFDAVMWSVLRVSGGLLLGFFVAVVLGILLSTSRTASRMLLPMLRILSPIAPIAWVPLGLAIFGIGNVTAVFIVFMGVAFFLTIATWSAVQRVDPEYLKVARTLGANRLQLWTRVIIPEILPQVFTLLRLNFFAAWMAVLAAEMVGLRNGLGAIIIVGRESANANLVLVGMCLIGMSGFLVDGLLLLVQRRLLWWDRAVE